MGKVKIKRKSTLIDMTAMSDVTVLLLTFFMLTSTFLAKEPVTVITPASVSEIKVPTSNVASILVSPEGKVFMSVLGEADIDSNDESWSSEGVRKIALLSAASKYEEVTGKKTGITQADAEKFAKIGAFGVRLDKMHEFLALDQSKQDEFMGDPANADAGIPLTDIVYQNADGGTEKTNEFQIWMRAFYNSGNGNLQDAMKKGEGIAVKADRGTNYSTLHQILDNLQTIKMNRFSVMTALKTEND
ncbi:MAG: biopolymer transporter ExbD [Muribaculaceae bacterium]|nr:biopolymer transporter ExbD [Muribaculaceae bacterium]MDE5845018.1 biopolymer transporter ExbD [Muribaculaceae bacterium]MDE7155808.1 biopolymer transporter ExbD [Muribaculaceae bacterium]